MNENLLQFKNQFNTFIEDLSNKIINLEEEKKKLMKKNNKSKIN